MRWDNLFDDLESQLEHELSAEDIDLQAEEERLRLGRMSIRDRLAALHEGSSDAGGYLVRVVLAGGSTIAVHPVALGKDWLSGDLVDESSRRNQCIVPLATVGGFILEHSQVARSLTTPLTSEPSRGLSARLSLVFVLRDLCRRRRALDFDLISGTIHGTIDRVGRDHLDLAIHERGAPRRESEVLQHRIVPLSQIRLVRL